MIGCVGVGVALVWGMEVETFLYCMVVLQIFTNLLLLFLASRGTGLLLELFAELDSKIAEAITKLINEGSIDIEPPNPILALLANIMQQKMGEMAPRSDTGQFVEVQAKVE